MSPVRTQVDATRTWVDPGRTRMSPVRTQVDATRTWVSPV